MVTGFERTGTVVYLDARENTNEGESHCFHMTVGRIKRQAGNSNCLFVDFHPVGWTIGFGPGSLVPCLDKKGPFFVGDVVFGMIAHDHHNHPETWCTCNAVGQITATYSRGIDVEFGYGRRNISKIIRMRRSDVRLATKGTAHLRHEEIQESVKPLAATCRRAADFLRLQHPDRPLACSRFVVGF